MLPYSLYVYCAAICTSSCQNGGTCTAPDTCTCDVGWTGMLCETGIIIHILTRPGHSYGLLSIWVQ